MPRAPSRLDRCRLLALAFAAAWMPLACDAALAGTPAGRAEAVVGDLADEGWGLCRSCDLDARTRAIEGLLAPMKTTLDQVDREIKEAELRRTSSGAELM